MGSGDFFDQTVGAEQVEFSGDYRRMASPLFRRYRLEEKVAPNIPVAEPVSSELAPTDHGKEVSVPRSVGV